MMPIRLGPERLPDDIESVAPGRFAPKKPKSKKQAEVTNPDSLLKSGVYVPDTSEE